MHVLVVTAWDPRRLAHGACLVLHHHLRILAARHRFTVLTPDRPPDPGSPATGTVPDGVSVESFPTSRPRSVDYVIRRIWSYRTGEPAHVAWVERSPMVRRIREILGSDEPDIVHLFGRGTARLARSVSGSPVIHMPLDPWTRGAANRMFPWWRRLVERGQLERIAVHERRHYPAADAIVVVAEQDARWLRGHVGDVRVEVVPNGVDAGPEPGPPSSDPVLAFHGAMDTEANLRSAFALVEEVLPRVRDHHPDAQALVVGRDPPDELLALTGRHVEVTGWVDDIRPWLSRAGVYVAPMSSGTGMKNKILEAMAAGLPVVATPAALQSIGPGPGVISAPTTAAVIRETVRLLDEPEARRQAAAAARARVEDEFTWERSAARLERIWSDLAG